MDLPSGTITFLYTDLEGSTRLWEEQTEDMSSALSWHDDCLKGAIEEYDGWIFKTLGDGACAAFARPDCAARAAWTAQLKLREHPELRVRMALHTGAAEQRAGDYFGPVVNRVTRMAAVGHGGQVLVSEVTQGLLRETLPPGFDLLDLGRHRLKDLTRPEHVYQLLGPDLKREFPPLRSLATHPHNLPIQPTPLVGREGEIRQLVEWLIGSEYRLLTLTGPAGTGKTRLALHVAAEVLEHFRDGVFFVSLAPVSDPDLVPTAVLQILRLEETADRSAIEALQEHVADRSMLLVLDNLEQVIEAALPLAEILSVAPELKVLVTSRLPLHLRGERQYLVPPLGVPDPSRETSLERLLQYEAVRLFVERARDVRPEFQITPENAAAVVEICRRLDGLPLAIELAAGHVRTLAPEVMLPRLESRLQLLTSGARDMPPRQQTLRKAIQWSHDLLNDSDRVLFRRLGVFSGADSLETISAVCDPDGELNVLDSTASLVESSMLRSDEIAGGQRRFVMLETLHEFARESLEASGEAREFYLRHMRYFLVRAEKAAPQLHGSTRAVWLNRLEADHHNFRTALNYALAVGEEETAARLAGSLASFWMLHGHLEEGRRWLSIVLSLRDVSERIRAMALYGAGRLAWRQADFSQAESFLKESLELYRALSDEGMIGRILNTLGTVAHRGGDFARAQALYERALTPLRAAGDQRYERIVLSNLAAIAGEQGEHRKAEARLRELLTIARNSGDVGATSLALHNLGVTAEHRGDLLLATSLYRESVSSSWEAGDIPQAVITLAHLAILETDRDPERAARLSGAVESNIAKMRISMSPGLRQSYDPQRASLRARFTPKIWERLWYEGAAMTLEEVIGYARD
jgi:predicted ATPase/class 3 adenylate cyclase